MSTVHDFNEAALRRAAVRLANSIGRNGLTQTTLDAASELRGLADHLGYGGDLLSLMESDTEPDVSTPPDA